MRILVLLLTLTTLISCSASKPHKFMKMCVDDRGLISCIYIERSGDTVGLDYISTKGLKMLLKGKINKIYSDMPKDSKKFKVYLKEYEKGQESKIEETHYFGTKEIAEDFIKKFNSVNTAETASDWYTRAEAAY